MLTTEALVADITEEKKGAPAGGMGDMYSPETPGLKPLKLR
jgi:hypothetical protein